MAIGVQAFLPDPAAEIIRLPFEHFEEGLSKLIISNPCLSGDHCKAFRLEKPL